MTIGDELRLNILERLKVIIDDLVDCECKVSDVEINNLANAYVDGCRLKNDIFERVQKWSLCDRKRFETRWAYLQERQKLEAESG